MSSSSLSSSSSTALSAAEKRRLAREKRKARILGNENKRLGLLTGTVEALDREAQQEQAEQRELAPSAAEKEQQRTEESEKSQAGKGDSKARGQTAPPSTERTAQPTQHDGVDDTVSSELRQRKTNSTKTPSSQAAASSSSTVEQLSQSAATTTASAPAASTDATARAAATSTPPSCSPVPCQLGFVRQLPRRTLPLCAFACALVCTLGEYVSLPFSML